MFRIVHGGENKEPAILDEKTYLSIKEATIFAPLHNSFATDIMDFLLTKYSAKSIACIFDTEFHKSIPGYAKFYALPKSYVDKYKIEKYGFHGLAFESAISEFKKKKGRLPRKVIALHAGGGVSVCAIKNGKSIDTTMGLTPTDGIMMLTRSGSIDPEIVRVLEERENLLPSEISKILNFKSGFYGLTGSKDTKKIIEKAKKGKEPFKSAYELFLYQIKKQFFAYAGVLGGVDAVLLSGGLAYNNEYFADDLLKQIKNLKIGKRQIVKLDINEDEIMLQKAKKVLG